MTILCYHAVDPAWRSPLAITPEAFEQHCRALARSGRVVELDRHLDSPAPRRPGLGPVALTFDDGFAGLASHVFPRLARYRLPAVVFLVAQTLTEQGQPVDWVDTPPPWPLRTLTVEQVLEAKQAGVGFASHSWAHHDLTTLSEQECVEDLRRSRELLEDLLHEPVTQLAYPRGRHSEHVRRAARRAGYQRALSLPEQREPTGPYAVPRVGVFPGNGRLALWGKTAPGYLAVRHSRAFPVLRRLARRPASPPSGAAPC